MSDKCPVCNSNVKEPRFYDDRDRSMYLYSCQRCGDYSIESSFKRFLPNILEGDKRKIAVLSHWIRTKHEAKAPPDKFGGTELITLNKELVDTIIKQPPPSLDEQVNNYIHWLGNNIEAGGDFVQVESSKHQAIMGAKTSEEFEFVFSHLRREGLIEANLKEMAGFRFDKVTLSFDGWKYYGNLKRGAIDSHKAFMAMKYGDEKLDKIVDETFKPAVKQTGFDLSRLVDRPQPAGLIDDRLRVEIQTSRFLIADLTHENRGAYWEAGYAEGMGKPVIYTCEKAKFEEQKTHFDTNHHLTVPWDAENLQEAAEELKVTIRATLPGEAKLTDE